jgi:hypothetical protein
MLLPLPPGVQGVCAAVLCQLRPWVQTVACLGGVKAPDVRQPPLRLAGVARHQQEAVAARKTAIKHSLSAYAVAVRCACMHACDTRTLAGADNLNCRPRRAPLHEPDPCIRPIRLLCNADKFCEKAAL